MNPFDRFHSFQENDWFSIITQTNAHLYSLQSYFIVNDWSNTLLSDLHFIVYLPFFHLCHSFNTNTRICPIDIPIVFIGYFAKIQTFRCTTHTIVFAHGQTNKKYPKSTTGVIQTEQLLSNWSPLSFFLCKLLLLLLFLIIIDNSWCRWFENSG